MKLLVGLGNPDEKYRKTFHNMGFLAVENAALLLGLKFTEKKCKALVAETYIKGEKVVLAKPQTYMNLSGESVKDLMGYYHVSPKDLLVFYDDYDLPKGTLRIRQNGSAGTHNGMRNIVSEIGSTEFPRVRVGIKDAELSQIPIMNYVLSTIREQDYAIYDEVLQLAGKAGEAFALGEDIESVMRKYNKK
ncbi:MAG: aminoacyl-tRNA hydrolase [Clostridiales bacterium]|nr:aminoacyl-tRNA hydrolase [Clostridiales bacterium]